MANSPLGTRRLIWRSFVTSDSAIREMEAFYGPAVVADRGSVHTVESLSDKSHGDGPVLFLFGIKTRPRQRKWTVIGTDASKWVLIAEEGKQRYLAFDEPDFELHTDIWQRMAGVMDTYFHPEKLHAIAEALGMSKDVLSLLPKPNPAQQQADLTRAAIEGTLKMFGGGT
ncbi:MAG: hypothetical protein JWM57_527 [Phycisphaerales bacterium]|nr:hypothetical protein [Phycisphaerales bacterium]